MALKRLRIDSILELREKKSMAELQAENEQLRETVEQQNGKIDLLEGCVMEIAGVIYSE